ncbi:hypothetical protein MICRO80W_150024 [Micrococcus luteus]|nr:hypothetical protein MICRO80W_150024 [Micrococcus luteus]
MTWISRLEWLEAGAPGDATASCTTAPGPLVHPQAHARPSRDAERRGTLAACPVVPPRCRRRSTPPPSRSTTRAGRV